MTAPSGAGGPTDGQGEAFFRGALDAMCDGVYFVDITRTITYWSDGAERLTGFAADDVVGHACFDRILNHVDDDGNDMCGSRCPLAATIRDGRPRQTRVFLHHRDGHRTPVHIRAAPMYGDDGAIVGAVETFGDDEVVLDMRRRLQDAVREAQVDPLTQLGNRRRLDVVLAQWFAALDAGEPGFVVMFVDIDSFKSVNDEWGHDVGDRVIQTVARTLSYAGRSGDVVVRYGGDEFVVLAEGLQGAEAVLAAAERRRRLVGGSRVAVGPRPVGVTVSVGATSVVVGDTAEQVLRRADGALHEAKRAGRNRTVTV